MTEPTQAPAETDVPLFDVVVKMPPGRSLEEVERLANAAGIQPERITALLRALRSVPEAKIGTAVTRERADRAKEQFGQAGLLVTLTPLLALQSMVTGVFDTSVACPACTKRVTLPENRQCPACGVFVDKVTDEFLLKRKIAEQERARLEAKLARDAKDGEKRTRDSLEAALRAKIREELEEEFGLAEKGGLFEGRAGKLRAAGLFGLVAVAFVGGNAVRGVDLPWTKKASAEAAPTQSVAPEVDKMLDNVGPRDTADASAGGASPSGDPDVDDPLIQAAGGKRVGAKGMSVEQAVAAAQILAKSVGNDTADRALAGGTVGGPQMPAGPGTLKAPGVPGAAPGVSGAVPGAPGTPSPAAAAKAGADGPAGSEGAAAASEVQIGRGKKIALAAEFARQLGELGQTARAREIIKSLKASPETQSDVQLAAALRLADYEVKAWDMRDLAEGKARRAADSLLADVATLPDPRERAAALSRMAAILSHHAQLPPAAAHAFLTQASESLKAIPDAQQRARVTGDWAVAMGEVLLSEVASRARMGFWSRATAAAQRLSTLTQQPSDVSAQARLLAIEHQAWHLLGQQDKATASLEAALALASKDGVAQRGAMLRRIAQLSGAPEHEKLQTNVTNLQALLEPLSGAEKAQALVQLALLQADAGLRTKADQSARLAQATSGLRPEESVAVHTDLIVLGDLAEARRLHAQAQYARLETIVRRLGDYLL